jgi:hypothetical protein
VREPLDRSKLDRFLAAVGAAATRPGRLCLSGGATALDHGLRERTVDVVLCFDPEPRGVLAAIARSKDELESGLDALEREARLSS